MDASLSKSQGLIVAVVLLIVLMALLPLLGLIGNRIVFALVFLALGGILGAATKRVFSLGLALMIFAVLVIVVEPYVGSMFAGTGPPPADRQVGFLVLNTLALIAGALITFRISWTWAGITPPIILLAAAPTVGYFFRLQASEDEVAMHAQRIPKVIEREVLPSLFGDQVRVKWGEATWEKGQPIPAAKKWNLDGVTSNPTLKLSVAGSADAVTLDSELQITKSFDFQKNWENRKLLEDWLIAQGISPKAAKGANATSDGGIYLLSSRFSLFASGKKLKVRYDAHYFPLMDKLG